MVTTFTTVMPPPFGTNRTSSARDFMDGPLGHHFLPVHGSCQVGASAHLLLHPHHRAHHMAAWRAFFAILSVPPLIFALTGAIGFLWLIAWWMIYRSPEDHPRVSAEELAYIRSDPPEPTERVGWGKLLTYKQTWAFVVAKGSNRR